MASTSSPRIPASAVRVVAAGTAAALDLDDPRRGLVLPAATLHQADELLGLDLRTPCRAIDRWSRGDDVVGVYEPADSRLLRATAMWRPCGAVGGAAWEVVVSAQTALEQSDASLAVTCDLAAEKILWGEAGAAGITWRETPPPDPRGLGGLLFGREAAGAASVLVVGFPGDVRRIVVEENEGRVRIACWVFSSAAEKGVLFRGRVLAALGPGTADTAWATAAWQRYAATPPVLTA